MAFTQVSIIGQSKTVYHCDTCLDCVCLYMMSLKSVPWPVTISMGTGNGKDNMAMFARGGV